MKKCFSLLCCLALFALGCSPEDIKQENPPHTGQKPSTNGNSSISVSGVSLNAMSLELSEGESYTLTATVQPSNATNKNVSWKSDNTSVATVSNGVVTALMEGTATIIVETKDGNKTATCEVNVSVKTYPVERVSLDKTSYEMTEGDEFILTATVYPENATNRNVSWSSSNTSVAIVSDGVVKAIKEGAATITVKTNDGKKECHCKVSVKAPVIIDLTSNGTANCYIVSDAGRYKIKTVKGNSTMSLRGVASAEVLHEWLPAEDMNAYYKDGYIYFTVEQPFCEGNALICAKDENGEILWSWHIWKTDVPQEQIYYNNAGTLMDRNLGATSVSLDGEKSRGLLYQWGRKDPFHARWSGRYVRYHGVSMEYAIKNPLDLYSGYEDGDWTKNDSDNPRWSSAKTIHDPCPLGWRVPDGGENGVWVKALNSSNNFNHWGGDFSGILGNDNILYPMPGYKHAWEREYIDDIGLYWSVDTKDWTGNYDYKYECAYTFKIGGTNVPNDYCSPIYWSPRGNALSVRCMKD